MPNQKCCCCENIFYHNKERKYCKSCLDNKENNNRSNLTNRPHYIYFLKDPFNNSLIYIGVTSDPKLRLRGHRSDTQFKNKMLLNFINYCVLNNANIKIEIIKEFENKELAYSMESKLIKKYQPIYNTKDK